MLFHVVLIVYKSLEMTETINELCCLSIISDFPIVSASKANTVISSLKKDAWLFSDQLGSVVSRKFYCNNSSNVGNYFQLQINTQLVLLLLFMAAGW